MAGFLNAELGDATSGFKYGEIFDYLACRFNDETVKFRDLMRTVAKDILWEIMAKTEWDWLRATASLSILGGTTEYSLEDDCQFVRGQIIIPNISVLERVHISEVRQILARTNPMGDGVPKRYAMTGRQSIIIAPSPGNAYTGDYDYTRYLTDDEQQMEDEDFPPVPTSDRHLLIAGMEMKLRLDDDRFDAGTRIAANRFEQLIFDMIWNEKSAARVDATPDLLPPTAG